MQLKWRMPGDPTAYWESDTDALYTDLPEDLIPDIDKMLFTHIHNKAGTACYKRPNPYNICPLLIKNRRQLFWKWRLR